MKKIKLKQDQKLRVEENAAQVLEKINKILVEQGLADFAAAGFHVVHRDSLQEDRIRCCRPGEEPQTYCDKWGRCVTTCVKC